jgi:hypothetical protein
MLAQGREGLPPVHGHGPGNTAYEQHQPEQTLLYQLVEAHFPALVEQLAQQGKSLPDHVHREFEAYLKCGRLEYGFLRVRRDNRPPRFQRVKAPDKGELEDLVQLISKRVGRCLERQGLLEQDTESAWLGNLQISGVSVQL